MKHTFCLLCLICLTTYSLWQSTYALDTSVLFEVHSSKVGNLYYEIVDQNGRIKNDLTYVIYNQSHELITQGTTENGILFIGNLPFGQYEIIIDTTSFSIEINATYLKSQHILKTLELGTSIFTQTNDYQKLFPTLYLSASSFLVLLILYKKRGFIYG